MKFKTIHIIQGIPGCGKSTLAKKLASEHDSAVICSADNFFMKEGKYKFDPRKIGQAHSQCYADYLFALRAEDVGAVIVDNTNITKWERQNYFNALLLLSMPSWRCVCHTFDIGEDEVDLCFQRCTHGVPIETIRSMWERMEPMRDSIIHCIGDRS